MADWKLVVCVLASVSCVFGANNVNKVCGPDTDDELQTAAIQSYNKAASWLKSQQNDQWGWEHTSSVVFALQLTNPDWFNRDDLESQLNVKQLEIELLAALGKRKTIETMKTELKEERTSLSDDLSAGPLAYHILALHATCHNVTDFYGHNLVHHLEREMKTFPDHFKGFNNYFQYGLAVLALCNTKSPVKEKHIQKLYDYASQEGCGGYLHGSDSTATVVTAMACVSEIPEFADDDKVKFLLGRGIENLTRIQEPGPDYGFGNIHTSALAAQALSAAGVSPSIWHCDDVIRGIIESQEESGSFGDHLMTTMQVLPSLVGRHYGKIDTSSCQTTEKSEQAHTLDPLGFAKTISVTLTVVYKNGTMESDVLYVPKGRSLYDIIDAASQHHDPKFTFDTIDSAWGHFVHAINGVSGVSGRSYWRIFNNEEALAAGVEDFYPENMDHIYFKYTLIPKI